MIKRKSDKLCVEWKGHDNSFNSWIDKKRYNYIKICYVPPYGHSKNKIKNDLDLPNYATKSDLNNPTGVDML